MRYIVVNVGHTLTTIYRIHIMPPMCSQVYFPALFTFDFLRLIFDFSRNCRDMSQSAVTKQNHQSAEMTFNF